MQRVRAVNETSILHSSLPRLGDRLGRRAGKIVRPRGWERWRQSNLFWTGQEHCLRSSFGYLEKINPVDIAAWSREGWYAHSDWGSICSWGLLEPGESAFFGDVIPVDLVSIDGPMAVSVWAADWTHWVVKKNNKEDIKLEGGVTELDLRGSGGGVEGMNIIQI